MRMCLLVKTQEATVSITVQWCYNMNSWAVEQVVFIYSRSNNEQHMVSTMFSYFILFLYMVMRRVFLLACLRIQFSRLQTTVSPLGVTKSNWSVPKGFKVKIWLREICCQCFSQRAVLLKYRAVGLNKRLVSVFESKCLTAYTLYNQLHLLQWWTRS